MPLHNNYNKIDDETRKHVDNMYNLIADYAKEHGIKIVGDDRAEKVVEAIATFILESQD